MDPSLTTGEILSVTDRAGQTDGSVYIVHTIHIVHTIQHVLNLNASTEVLARDKKGPVFLTTSSSGATSHRDQGQIEGH